MIKTNKIIKRLKSFLGYLDQINYAIWYNKSSFSVNFKNNIQYKSEFRRNIHSLEVSSVLSRNKNSSHGINSAKYLKYLIEKTKENNELKSIRQEAIEALMAFKKKSTINKKELNQIFLVNETNICEKKIDLSKELIVKNQDINLQSKTFSQILRNRRSIREYINKKVPKNVIENSIIDASFTPSACNRQPWKVYQIFSEEKKNVILQFQNNHANWRKNANILLICVDLNFYSGSREKHAPFIDGGLFSMSIMLSLSSKGINTCPLNLNNKTSATKKLINKLGIAKSEMPIMLIAYGYSPLRPHVTKGEKKQIKEIVKSL